MIMGTRVVIKSRGARDFPRLLLLENKRKIEPQEIPSPLIPSLLVVFIRQLEILVTTLRTQHAIPTWILRVMLYRLCEVI